MADEKMGQIVLGFLVLRGVVLCLEDARDLGHGK